VRIFKRNIAQNERKRTYFNQIRGKMRNDWSIDTDSLDEGKQNIEVVINGLIYRLDHKTEALTQLLSIINESISEIQKKIDYLDSKL
jgi:hypothetical protein